MSHITVLPPQKAQIYGAVQQLIKELRERAATTDQPSGEYIRADILEQVVLHSRSSLAEVALRIGLKPDDELFIQYWEETAAQVKLLMESN